jgi:cytochrome c peroxidase
MKKTSVIICIAGAVLATYSCNKNNSTTAVSSKVYLDLPAKTANYFATSTTITSPDTMNLQATLGRVLFYDPRMSVNNATSCASCHKQTLAFADNSAFSRGFENKLTVRNSPAIQNIVGESKMVLFMNGFESTSLFWDGRVATAKDLISRPITNHVEMGITDMSVLTIKLSALSYYPPLFKSAFGDETVTSERISTAVAAFISSIKSNHSRFDEYKNGNGTLTAQELQGMALFTSKYNCAKCHNVDHTIGNNYTAIGNNFVDIGLEDNYKDKGRGIITGNTTDKGKFKIPDLKNVALTAPYMHDGRYKTLDEVLEHYSSGILYSQNLDTLLQTDNRKAARKMNIGADDKKALIAFLNALTDNTVTTDPKFSNPFKIK